jgi:hypothetical protein
MSLVSFLRQIHTESAHAALESAAGGDESATGGDESATGEGGSGCMGFVGESVLVLGS